MTADGHVEPPGSTTGVHRRVPNADKIRPFFLGLIAGCGLTMGFTAALTAPLAIELGASEFAAGVSVSSLTMIVLIADIFGTRALPYLEPRRSIVFGMAMWGIGSIATTFSPTFALLEASRLVQGVGVCVFAAAGSGLALRLAQQAHFGKALGEFHSAQIFGSMTAPIFGGGVVALWPGEPGLRIAFFICGLLAFACAIAAHLLLPSLPTGVKPRLSKPYMPGLGRPRSLAVVSTAAVGQGMRGTIVLTVVPLLAATTMSMTTFTVGVFLFATYSIETLVGRNAGALSDRIGRRPIVLIGAVAGIIGVAMLLIAHHHSDQVLFCLTTIPFGFSGGILIGVLPTTVVDMAAQPEVGVAGMRLSRDLGFSVMPVMVGAMLTASGTVPGLAFCGVVFVMVIAATLGVGETSKVSREGLTA